MATHGGPNLNRSKTEKTSGSPLHFLRIMRYARAHRRLLIPGLIGIAVTAAMYSVNIAALLPAFQVIQGDEGIPTWVDNWVAGNRLGVTLDMKGKIVQAGEHASENFSIGDELIGMDHHREAPAPIFAGLARLGADASGEDSAKTVTLTVDRKGAATDVTVRLRKQTLGYRLSLWAAGYMPATMNYQSRMNAVILIVAAVMVIAVVGAIARFFGEYLIALVAAKTVVGMRREMYRRVLRSPVSQFTQTNDLVSRFVQDSQDIYRGLNFVFAKSLREPLKAVFVFGVALVIDWRITLVTVLAAPPAALFIRKIGKTIRRSSKRLLEGYGRMLSALDGALTGIRVVKGYTMEGYERRRLYALDLQMLGQEMKIERIDAMSSPLFETGGRIIASVALVYFAHLMFTGVMTFSKVGTLAACMAAMFDPIRQMSGFYNRMQRANAAADRVFEILDRPVEIEGGGAALRPLPTIGETIEFRDLTFTYPGNDVPALDHVSLKVRRGERVALVGPNGSGKTTLVSTLLRFFDAQSGDILIDGHNIRDHSIVSLRKQISLVTQDTIIFPDTIEANIAYGDEDLLRRIVLQRRHPERKYLRPSDRERVVAAATAAYADEFIREKPDGYDTLVGEKGTTLSGGQKQRLAIARAMLRNAPIFVFDEATSQIDSDSERKIHDAVERFLADRTAFIIAHRFSTILQADRIVVMDRGRIVDMGKHAELKERCGLYRTLYGTQILDDGLSSMPVADAAVV